MDYRKDKKLDPFSIKEGRFGNIEGFSYRLEWTEDSFVAGGPGQEIIGRTFNYKRTYFIGLIFAFFLLLILSKAAWLQIIKGKYYYSIAEGNRIRIERVEAKRGVIYDRNLKPLVRNVANFLLYFIPADLPQEESKLNKIINEISQILGNKNSDEIKRTLSRIKTGSLESYQPLFIADNIEYEKAILLYLKQAEMSGVVLSNKTRREYDICAGSDQSQSGEKCALALSHVLGYMGKISEEDLDKFGGEYSPIDYIGKAGIEYFWEPDLRGINGKKQIEVDALGKEKKIISQTEAQDGHNLVLSIDLDLEKKLGEAMANAFKGSRFKKGTAIIMNPANGEILAKASFPFYNNNIFARGMKNEEYEALANDQDKPLFNRAISGEYPPGSTIKPIIAAAALEEEIINEYTSFLSTGGLKIGEWFFPDWKAGGHGATNVRKAIAESVNTFFYYIGGGYNDFTGLGVDRIVKYEKLFGLGAQTGIDLPGEANGFLPTKEWKEAAKGERWYIGDTYHLAIGQGDISATPLQVAAYTSVFANGGKLYRPHLVRQILSSDDSVLQDIKEEPVKKDFISAKNIETVRQGMRQTITSGSARGLGDLPVAVAGKTGTAQWSSKKAPHAWFTGFAPYDNPEIVITVLVEDFLGLSPIKIFG
ncbi:penicillin-binding protein 2 [Candidatus Falkowbacteria bacterium]|nr:penicillin-binding protein 2 [Candidatus Falkowbacteria bacterium]